MVSHLGWVASFLKAVHNSVFGPQKRANSLEPEQLGYLKIAQQRREIVIWITVECSLYQPSSSLLTKKVNTPICRSLMRLEYSEGVEILQMPVLHRAMPLRHKG